MSHQLSDYRKKNRYELSSSSESDHENELCRMKIRFNGQRVRKTSFRLPRPDVARRRITAGFADLRDKIRAENRQLQKSGEEDDHKTSKSVSGGWALAPEQIHYLKTHDYEYNASAGSVLELLVLQRFWINLARFVPERIAPCTITAVGFLINLVTCSLMIIASPDAKSEVPSWCLALCALGVFLYQICDALDGKQCYKVQNTQIEEFYDHGCDAVSTILLMYSVGIATQCGQHPSLFLCVMFTALVAFYCTHWVSYVTNQMVFGKIDVTEGQWSMITIHLLSAFFGQSIWRTTVTLPLFGYSITLTHVLALLSLATFVNSIVHGVGVILFGWRTPLESAGINFPRRHGLYRLVKPILPIALLTTLMFFAYGHGYFHLNATWFVLAFGFTYAKLTMKLVIAHCTNHEIELNDPSLLAPMLLVLNHSLGPFGELVLPSRALLCALLCNGIEMVRYFTCVSWDLRVALDVAIFNIRYPPGHAKNRRVCRGFYINGLNNTEVLQRVN